MFEKHFGLSENPFLSGPQPKYLYPSLGHQEAVAHLRHAVRNREPFVLLITGGHGVGKTVAVHDALSEWGSEARIALITNPALTREQLVDEIALRLGLEAAGLIHTVADLELHLASLRASGQTAFLLVDEAQHLDVGLLAELTELTDLQSDGESLLHIIMIGHPALEMLLARPDLKALAERVGPRYLVEPLGAAETTQYLHHRVSVAGGNPQQLFPADTCAKLFQVTRGVPSQINTLAGRALHQAFAAGASGVAPEHVSIPEPAAADAGTARESGAFAALGAGSMSTEGGIDMARALSSEMFPDDPPAANEESGQSGNEDEAERILPSWFDDIIAKRKTTEEPAPPAPAPVAAPVAVPAPAPAMSSQPTPAPEPAPPPALPSQPTPAPESTLKTMAPVVEFVALEPFSPAPADEPASSIPPPILLIPGTEPVAEVQRSLEAEPVAAEETPEENEALVFDSVAPTGRVESLIPPVEAVASSVENESADEADTDYEVPAELLEALEFDEGLEENQQPDQAEVGSGPAPALAPIDFVEHREDYPTDERPRPVPNPGWPVAAALVACVIICAYLIIRLLPAALHPTSKATTPTSAPPVTQVPATDQSGAPTPESNPPAPKSVAKPEAKPVPKSGAATNGSKPAQKPVTATTAKKPVAAPVPTPKPAPVKTETKREPAPTTTEPERAVTKAPPAAGQNYVISVGSYLFEDRAVDRMTSLSAATGVPARVVTFSEDGGTSYRVVLGMFGSRAAAEKKADELIERGLVQEARVIADGKPGSNP